MRARPTRSAKAVENNTEACRLVDSLSKPLVDLPDDACPNLRETGFGRQQLPMTRDSKGGLLHLRACDTGPIWAYLEPPVGPLRWYCGRP